MLVGAVAFEDPNWRRHHADEPSVFQLFRGRLDPYAGGLDDVDATRALRHELERALPNTKLEVDWDYVLRQEEHPPEPTQSAPPTVVDANSRDENGEVNAMAAWLQGGRKGGI